jgi:hypothetical protein
MNFIDLKVLDMKELVRKNVIQFVLKLRRFLQKIILLLNHLSQNRKKLLQLLPHHQSHRQFPKINCKEKLIIVTTEANEKKIIKKFLYLVKRNRKN